jgi:hypothetical protein
MNKTKKYFAMAMIVAMAFTGSLFAESSLFNGAVVLVNSTVEDTESLTIDPDSFSSDTSDYTVLLSTYTINNNSRNGYYLTITSTHGGYLLADDVVFADGSVTDPGHAGNTVEDGDKIDYKIKLTSDTGFDQNGSEHWGDSTASVFSTFIGANNDAPVSPTNIGLAAGTDVPDDGVITVDFTAGEVDMSTDDADLKISLVIPNESNLFANTFADTITIESTSH